MSQGEVITAGYDNIPMSVIKQTIDSIPEPLIHVINLYIVHSIVPDEGKIARVISVFKASDQSLFTNYSPIFIRLSFSNRVINYLNKLDILSNSPYGFRKGRSTSLVD